MGQLGRPSHILTPPFPRFIKAFRAGHAQAYKHCRSCSEALNVSLLAQRRLLKGAQFIIALRAYRGPLFLDQPASQPAGRPAGQEPRSSWPAGRPAKIHGPAGRPAGQDPRSSQPAGRPAKIHSPAGRPAG